jgi:hypothetical protein
LYSVTVTNLVAGAEATTGAVSQPVSQAFFLPKALALLIKTAPATKAKAQPVIFLTNIF